MLMHYRRFLLQRPPVPSVPGRGCSRGISHPAISCRLTAHAEQLPMNQKEPTANLEKDRENPGHVLMSVVVRPCPP